MSVVRNQLRRECAVVTSGSFSCGRVWVTNRGTSPCSICGELSRECVRIARSRNTEDVQIARSDRARCTTVSNNQCHEIKTKLIRLPMIETCLDNQLFELTVQSQRSETLRVVRS